MKPHKQGITKNRFRLKSAEEDLKHFMDRSSTQDFTRSIYSYLKSTKNDYDQRLNLLIFMKYDQNKKNWLMKFLYHLQHQNVSVGNKWKEVLLLKNINDCYEKIVF